MENVPALAVDGRMKKVIKDLKNWGYQVDPANIGSAVRVLNAAAYGVPQRRKRMIMIAGRDSRLEFASPRISKATVRRAIGRLAPPGEGNDPLHDYAEARAPDVLRRIKMVPPNGGSRKDIGKEYQLGCHKKCDGFKDVYGRMAWDDVSPTLTSGCTNPSKGRFLHPEQHRAITLREAALLQSFPLTYKLSLRRGRQGAALMIGNALPPEFIRHHAKSIAEQLGG